MASNLDIKQNRLDKTEYKNLFCDSHHDLNLHRAQIAAHRCYYCYEAPCIKACPTEIDIPSFIGKIATENVFGAAKDILKQNIMGGTCARVCPVETLCQEACVRNTDEDQPVEIGKLQKFATDRFFENPKPLFGKLPNSGKTVAIVGTGPAGLSCAHQLARLGHEVVVYEGQKKAGGLNEYGLAPYKITNEFVDLEIQYILSIGGISIKYDNFLGRDISLESLKRDHDAVFLGIGLGNVNQLQISGEESSLNAVDFIKRIRQVEDLSTLPVGKHVVIIGGGSTAIDIAIEMKKLGSEFVTLTYRRGVEHMNATSYERDLVQKNGVLIKPWIKPHKINSSEIIFEYTTINAEGNLTGTDKFITFKADQVFRAIGQRLEKNPLEGLKIEKNKIKIDSKYQTSLPLVFAAGDCITEGDDLTVSAVQNGKLAAFFIDTKLKEVSHG